jgi:hypothetical protein
MYLEEMKDVRVRIKDDADNYYTVEEGERGLTIEVSDVFLHAQEDVLEALSLVILSKVYMVPYMPDLWERVKGYLESDDCIERSQRAFLQRSKTVRRSPRGDHHDLRRSLGRIKERYFSEEGFGFKEPTVVWSSRRSHQKFGYWMADYNIIVVNRVLDNPNVPEDVVDFVVFHELLHKKHGFLNLAGASEAHYQSFNLDERRFDGHEEVERFLGKIYKTRGKCLK